MVRELHLAFDLPCSVQEFHKAVYAERRVLEKYHRETTGDHDATVSEWRYSEEGNKQQRTVKYQVPLAVPVAIKKLIGAEVVQMEEEQYKSFDEQGSFSVTSSPVALMTGGSKFRTEMRVRASPAEEGCKVTATIACTAAGPWGMQGTIESVMVAEAEKGSKRFLDFCKQECAQLLKIPAPSPAPSAPSPQPETSESDRFFDAQGSLDRASSAASEIPSIAQLEEDAVVAVPATLSYLKQLHTKLCEVQQSQQRLESRLASLATDIQASSTQLPQQARGPSPQGGISLTWQGYLPAGLLLCSTAAIGAYFLARSRRQQ